MTFLLMIPLSHHVVSHSLSQYILNDSDTMGTVEHVKKIPHLKGEMLGTKTPEFQRTVDLPIFLGHFIVSSPATNCVLPLAEP